MRTKGGCCFKLQGVSQLHLYTDHILVNSQCGQQTACQQDSTHSSNVTLAIRAGHSGLQSQRTLKSLKIILGDPQTLPENAPKMIKNTPKV